MTELFKMIRFAFYVCALPIVATAVVSAQNLGDAPHVGLGDQGEQQPEELVPISVADNGIIESSDMHNHVVVIDQDGGISGRVAVLDRVIEQTVAAVGVDISINRKGAALARATTNWNGEFRVDGLKPGAYTFIASSPNSVATYGIYVSANPEKTPAANTIQIDVVAVADQTAPVREVLNADYDFRQYSYTPNPDQVDMPVVTGPNRVQLDQDGNLVGRVVPLDWESETPTFNLIGNDVYLFQSGQLIAQVPVDASGHFLIEGLEPGMYDFASAGPHGSAAFCLNVLGHEPVTQTGDSPMRLASARTMFQGGAEAVLGEPAGGNDTSVDVEVIVNVPPATGFAPGSGGSGGAFGGLGDFGGLISAALAAWILSEAFDNDRNRVQQPVVLPPVVEPPPVSPF